MGGIYQIVNLVNNKSYIGSAVNIDRRWREHISRLKKKTHNNRILQRAWNKYGEEFFSFEIVEKCENKILIAREQHYIDTILPVYNICPIAASSLGLKRSKESIEKVLLTKGKKKFKVFTKDKKLIGEWLSKKECARFLGLKSGANITTCLNGKYKSLKGYVFLYSTEIDKLDEKIKLLPKQSVKEFDVFMNESYIGTWSNCAECARTLNLKSYKVIHKCLKNVNNSYRGYTFKYKEGS